MKPRFGSSKRLIKLTNTNKTNQEKKEGKQCQQ